MKEKHRIAPHPAAFSFTLALLLVMTALFASSCGESSETHSLKATISAQATQLAEVALPTVTSLASPTPPTVTVLASPTLPPPEPKPHASLIPIWSIRSGLTEPLVVGDVIVTSTAEGYLTGLMRATGEELWLWDLTDVVFASDQQRVYVAGSEKVYALELHTGERVWKIEGSILIDSETLLPDPAGLYDGMLYFVRSERIRGPLGELTAVLVAVDASSGEEKWVFPLGSSYSFPRGVPTRVLPDVFIVSPRTGNYAAGLDPQTGELLWSRDDLRLLLYGKLSVEIEGDIVVNGEPKDQSARVMALEAKSGYIKWELEEKTAVGLSLEIYGNLLFVGSIFAKPQAVDPSDGAIIWAWDDDAIGNPIGVVGDVIVFSSPSRSSIYGINAPDGATLWDLDLQGPHRWIGASGGIAILLNPAGVYGVDITSGKRIWKVEKENSYINDSRFVFMDIGLLFSSGKGGADVDLIDPVTGEIKWSQQTSGWVRWIVDADDLVLIVSGYGWGNLPITLNAYEKVR